MRFLQTLQAFQRHVWCICQINADLLACGMDDGKILLINLNTKKIVGALEGHTMWVSSLLLLKNGQLASTSCDATVKIWNMSTLTCIHTFPVHETCITSIVECSNTGDLYTTSRDNSIRCIANPNM